MFNQLLESHGRLENALNKASETISALARDLAATISERDLLEQERDMALLELDKMRGQHELHHGGPR